MTQHTRKSHFLGTKLRALRKRNGLTLEELSARCIQLDSQCAPSVSYLSMIESGKRIPSADVLRLLSSVFQRDAGWFLDGNPDIAARNLELMVASVLESSLLHRQSRRSKAILDRWTEAMDCFAAEAYEAYRRLAGHPSLVPYFLSSTPVEELGKMNIGSRPSRRPGGVGGVDDLRAIPWVFGWTQTRQIVPGWFGVGAGLRGARQAGFGDTMREMAREWSFLRTFVSNVEMTLFKTDLDISASYVETLVAEEHRSLLEMIRAEHDATIEEVLALLGAGKLLEDSPLLERTLDVRDIYLDPINYLQVSLLARSRAGEASPMLDRALLLTVNGIAAGMRNTG